MSGTEERDGVDWSASSTVSKSQSSHNVNNSKFRLSIDENGEWALAPSGQGETDPEVPDSPFQNSFGFTTSPVLNQCYYLNEDSSSDSSTATSSLVPGVYNGATYSSGSSSATQTSQSSSSDSETQVVQLFGGYYVWSAATASKSGTSSSSATNNYSIAYTPADSEGSCSTVASSSQSDSKRYFLKYNRNNLGNGRGGWSLSTDQNEKSEGSESYSETTTVSTALSRAYNGTAPSGYGSLDIDWSASVGKSEVSSTSANAKLALDFDSDAKQWT